MAYQTKYITSFSNHLEETYQIWFEFKDFIGDAVVINSAGSGFSLRSTSGDENKLAPLLGTECQIEIMVGKVTSNGVVTDDSSLTIFDLIAQHDNDIRVTIYRVLSNGSLYQTYQGFVVVEDNSQPFQDPPFVLSLRALDGIGLLKNVDMTDANGELFAGNLSVEDWIGNILMKTGQTLNLRVYFPFYPIGITGDIGSPLQQVFVNAITWQTGELTTTTDPSVNVFASEALDAYSALEAICRSFRMRLFQEDGVWNVVSLYSYVDPNDMSYFESTPVLTAGIYNMIPVSVGNNIDTNIPVGKESIVRPVEQDQNFFGKLATKWVKLNYTYDQSVNKVCNQNFKLGNPDAAHNGTISSDIENPSIQPAITFDYKGYFPFCWTTKGGQPLGGPYPETAQTAYSYIRNVLDITGATENRYMVLQAATPVNHMRSSTFLVDVNDALQISCDFRTSTNLPIGTTGLQVAVFYVLLDGDDGSKWGLGVIGDASAGSKWYLLDANYNYPGLFQPPANIYTYLSGDSTMNWVTASVDRNLQNGLIKVPVSGTCFIILNGLPSGPGGESWYKNLSITILPYLWGSYVQLKGDYNFSSTGETYKLTMSEEVQISDSPKRYFKGALLKANGDLVPAIWHRKGRLETFRFQQGMERVVYNNIFRPLEKIEGSFRGLTWVLPDWSIKMTGYINTYCFLQHPKEPTKRFLLCSFEKNYVTGIGRHVFVEILENENADGFILPEDYLFQYTYQ